MRGYNVVRRQRSTTFAQPSMGSCMSSPTEPMPRSISSTLSSAPRSSHSNATTPTLKKSFTSSSDSSRIDSPLAKHPPPPMRSVSSNATPTAALPSPTRSNNFDSATRLNSTSSAPPQVMNSVRPPPHMQHRNKPSVVEVTSMPPRSPTQPDFANRGQYGHSTSIWSEGQEIPSYNRGLFNRTRSTDVVDTSHTNYLQKPRHAAPQTQQQPAPKPIPKGESKFEQRMAKRDFWAKQMVAEGTVDPIAGATGAA